MIRHESRVNDRQRVYELDVQEVGDDFAIFAFDVDPEDDRIDSTLILDLALWMEMGRPDELRISMEPL